MDEAQRSRLEEQKQYAPESVEPSVFERWMDARAFEANADDPGEPFSIAIPPPNVTGALHMGHALNGTIQDTLIRLRRMQGRNALWIFGMDHAGIAVQNVVERLLASEGLTRHDLGRERFVQRVWQWKAEFGGIITGQFQRLGCSLDYRRERFTMDEAYARAVMKVFVQLYRQGYLFRDNRMINWCSRCSTAISDLEVEHRDVEDTLYEIDYPLEGGGHVTVATVRPATMLGDTGVAVNPNDERYSGLVGRRAIVPLAERSVPIVADDYVDVGFGTGALKITPGHDPNDFELGRRHGLEELQVIGFDGRMTDEAGGYAGLPADEAGERIVADLRERGLLRAERPYGHAVGHCSRCGTRVEPLVSLQWFCEMTALAAPAIVAVREGRVRFHPQNMERIYFDWMESIRPWCVSRQLWWGHQLPVWYCSCGETIVQEDVPAACPSCGGGSKLERDPDVLDTWFSSALWPFATLGWPERTPDLETFFPTHVLSTARDIINLWVARMVMSSLELLDVEPFADVNVHSTVLAADGRRMSKSLGTGVDPLNLIERYGADAVRYGLLKMSSTQDVRFSEGMIEEGRRLTNKLWNAARLILLNADDVPAEPRAGEPVDAWILGRLDRAAEELTSLLDRFEFSAATKVLYRVVFDEVCDWYLEAAKLRLYGDDEAARRDVSATLLFVLDRTLRLAHPILPHITEELWSFARHEGLLLRAEWPPSGQLPRDEAVESAVTQAFDAVVELRRLRDDAGVGPREPLTVAVEGGDRSALRGTERLLAGLGHVQLDGDGEGVDGGFVPISLGDVTLRVVGGELAGRLRPRLQQRLGSARSERERAERKLQDERFVSRAPEHLVAAEREKAERFAREADELERRLASLG